MNPFENEGEDYKDLEDSNFHLSRDMSLSNLLEHDRDNQSRFSTSKIKPEEANISSIKQKIIDRDELLRELNKLRSANEDLTTENEKYKDEVVELRERLVQSTSAGNINKLHEQINHLKSLNEQLTQRVHNLEKELGGKEGNESDKKALKTLRKELETKEEELAANRQLLESSYVTVQKYKEKLQKMNVTTKSGRTMSQNLSTVKIQHCNITAMEAMRIREVVAGDSAWHVKVIGLQEEVINLKNRVYELDVINYKQQLELLKYKTGQLKPKSEEDLEEDLSLYKGVGDVEDVIQKRVEELFNSRGKSLVQDFVEKQLGKKGAEDDNKLRLGEQEESLDWLNFMEKEEEIKKEKKEVKKGKEPRKEKEKKEDKQKKEKEKEKKDIAKKESKTRDRDSSGEEVMKKKVKMDVPSKENIAKNITRENNIEQQAQFNVREIGSKKEKEVVVPMVVEKDVKASPQQQKKPVLKSNDPRRKISQSKDALVQPPPPVVQQQVNPEKELEEMFRTDSKDSKDSKDEGKQEQKVQSQALHGESSEQRIDTGKVDKEKIEEEFLAFGDWDKEEDTGKGSEREKMNVEEENLHQLERDKINEEDKTEAKYLEEKNGEHPMQVEDTTSISVKDQAMTNIDQNLIVEEPQAMITEPGEIEAKPEKAPEEVKEVVKAKEAEKVNLQDLDRQIDEAIKEGRFSSRTELVENSFETIMSLYLHKFEAAKYFDPNDNGSFNKRKKLLEVLMGAINIEGLSEIAMKIIETFVKLSKKHQFSCLAFCFWAFLKDVTSLSSRSYTTSLNRLAGSLYNYLLLPYISKKQHEGQHTQLQDFTSLEKWRYLAFISNILEVPLDSLDEDLAFGALLEFKDYDDIVSRHMEALTKLNVFTNNPLQVLLLVGILSIYKTCQKALPVLDILIDLVCYQTENQVSHCNLIFVTISSAWRFIRENLGLLSPHNAVDEGFLIEGSSFAYLFAFKFLPLPEEHPYVYNLDLIFVVLRLAVLRIFSKLPENDAAQSIKLKLMINKLREQPADTLRDMYEEGFKQWLSDNLRMQKLNDQVWETEQTVSLYKDNHAPALNIFYEFAKECLTRGLKAENPLILPQDTDPKEIQVENGVNVIDIVISLQVAGSLFTQTEWCDQLIEGTLFKYIQGDEYKDSLQRILTIAGLGLFLANIQSEDCTERVNELLVNVVTGREGDYSMLDRLMAFVVLGTYNSDLLRENLGEVRIDDRLIEYLEGDILDIYMSA